MLTEWAVAQIHGPIDVLALFLVIVILIIGAPIIALIANGFRRDFDEMDSDQRSAWISHIKSINGPELRVRDQGGPEPKRLDDWGFWSLEEPPGPESWI